MTWLLRPAEWLFGLLPGWLARAIARSLAYLGRVPADRTYQFGPDTYDRDWMIRSLEDFQAKELSHGFLAFVLSHRLGY